MTPAVLGRALEPWPVPLRTLDAMHLASLELLRSRRQEVALASYDSRLIAAAQRLAIPLHPLPTEIVRGSNNLLAEREPSPSAEVVLVHSWPKHLLTPSIGRQLNH
jgi:hypothetical protein